MKPLICPFEISWASGSPPRVTKYVSKAAREVPVGLHAVRGQQGERFVSVLLNELAESHPTRQPAPESIGFLDELPVLLACELRDVRLRGVFDGIQHPRLPRAVERHTDAPGGAGAVDRSWVVTHSFSS
jgi:hypothetical protein